MATSGRPLDAIIVQTILRKLARGESIRRVSRDMSVSPATIVNIKRQSRGNHVVDEQPVIAADSASDRD